MDTTSTTFISALRKNKFSLGNQANPLEFYDPLSQNKSIQQTLYSGMKFSLSNTLNVCTCNRLSVK